MMYESMPSSDRMCTSPSVYASTQTAFKMAAASRERTRSGSTTSSTGPGSAQTFFELPVGGVQNPLNMAASGSIGRFKEASESSQKTFLIGVAGGTASGKSTVCQRIVESFNQNNATQNHRRVDVISQECFYKKLEENDQLLASKGQYDFDHPDAFDEALMLKTINDIKAGRSVSIPEYDYVKNCGDWEKSKVICPVDVILIEGILVFYFKSVREAFNMKLFVDTDADTRLSRRVLRDIKDRGRTLDTILGHYINFVKPAFEEFCLPTKKYADVIIPRGADNLVAIDLIVQHIQDLLKPAKVDLATQMSINSTGDSTGSFKSVDDRETPYTSAH